MSASAVLLAQTLSAVRLMDHDEGGTARGSERWAHGTSNTLVCSPRRRHDQREVGGGNDETQVAGLRCRVQVCLCVRRQAPYPVEFTDRNPATDSSAAKWGTGWIGRSQPASPIPFPKQDAVGPCGKRRSSFSPAQDLKWHSTHPSICDRPAPGACRQDHSSRSSSKQGQASYRAGKEVGGGVA